MRTSLYWKTLGLIDLRSVTRDSMLRWMAAFPLLIALLIRWALPLLTAWIDRQLGYDLTPYYDLLASVLLLLMPMMTGVVIGFLLLDQRDDQTLTALQVTPLTLGRYLAYRITLPALLGALTTLLLLPLARVVPVDAATLLGAAVLGAPLSPLFALALFGFARNKVQGFALMKAGGVLMWPNVIAYFIAPPWQWAFGLLPTYWPMKFFWARQAGEADAWIFLPIGLAWQFILLWLLLRRFRKVAAA